VVLPEDSVAVSMDCTFCHVSVVVVLQVNGMLQEAWREEPHQEGFFSDVEGRGFVQGFIAVEAEATLEFDVLGADLGFLLGIEFCVVSG